MEATVQEPAPELTAHKPQSEAFSGRNPHEDQMDDLFGDMRRQQAHEEAKEEMDRVNTERFTAKTPSGTEGGKQFSNHHNSVCCF